SARTICLSEKSDNWTGVQEKDIRIRLYPGDSTICHSFVRNFPLATLFATIAGRSDSAPRLLRPSGPRRFLRDERAPLAVPQSRQTPRAILRRAKREKSRDGHADPSTWE